MGVMSKAILYINGLGDGTTQGYEVSAFKKMRTYGVKPIHAHVCWREEQEFNALLTRLTKQAKDLVKKNGSLTIVGLSAGSSMALNVYSKLKDKDVQVINIVGRLKRGKVPTWSYRTPKRAAHLNTPRASRGFYDSMIYCEDETIPSFTKRDKARIVMLKPITDLVVPLHTMNIDGVKNIQIVAFGHSMACSVGLNKAAELLKPS
jgi:hypothetical protein